MNECNEQFEVLKRIEHSIDVCQKKINELVKTDDFLDKIKQTDAKTKAYISWASAYGIYTSYYMHLLLNEEDPKMHQISKEIKRLQNFHEKLKRAVNGEEKTREEVDIPKKKYGSKERYLNKIKGILKNKKE